MTQMTPDDPDDGVDEPYTNYSVVRVTRDIFTGSSVGVIAINKQDSDIYNRTAGLDFSYRPKEKSRYPWSLGSNV